MIEQLELDRDAYDAAPDAPLCDSAGNLHAAVVRCEVTPAGKKRGHWEMIVS